MPTVGEKLSKLKTLAKQGPVWEGPSGTGPNGGVTQSLLQRWLSCRDRFRVRTIEGLKPSERFSKYLEYGNMWHLCEEVLAKTKSLREFKALCELQDYRNKLFAKYPFDREDVEKWYNVCRIQFPEYVRFWSEHPDTVKTTPLLQEQVFSVPYRLPSGRTVRLRGKWDGVDLLDAHVENGVKYQKGLWLFETKTKGEVDRQEIEQQLRWDLQTQMYLAMLEEKAALGRTGEDDDPLPDECLTNPILGVRYNVVRRPLSGGKGTIVRHEATAGAKCPKCKAEGRYVAKKTGVVEVCDKCNGACRIGGKPAETEAAYYDRLAQYIKDEPETYFFRWKAAVTPQDVERFRRETLDPILEQLACWYGCVTGKPELVPPWAQNYRHPFGCENSVNTYGASDVDAYLDTGSTSGLRKVTDLFPELS